MKRKTFVIYVKNEPVEVSEKVYRTYWQSIEKERYLSKKIRETWIYLDHLFDEYENNSLEYSLLEDLNPTANEAIKNELIEIMLNEVKKLPQDEQDLLYSFYFEGNTHTDYGKRVGLTPQAISLKHRVIIEKLRKTLDF